MRAGRLPNASGVCARRVELVRLVAWNLLHGLDQRTGRVDLVLSLQRSRSSTSTWSRSSRWTASFPGARVRPPPSRIVVRSVVAMRFALMSVPAASVVGYGGGRDECGPDSAPCDVEVTAHLAGDALGVP